MLRLFFTPEWFQGLDLLFETVGLIAALLIAAYSWKIYSSHKENRFAYFSFAFMLVAVSLFLKMFSSGVLYFTPLRDTVLDVLRPTVGARLRFTNVYYAATFFVQMASLLGGWLLIFFISQKSRARLTRWYEVSQIALFVYLVSLIAFIGHFNYVVFYLTGSVLLALIVLNYYKNYLNNANSNTFRVMMAFMFILLSHLFFTFIFLLPGLYVIGQIFLLAGFSLLLYTYQKVIRKERKLKVEILPLEDDDDGEHEGDDDEEKSENEEKSERENKRRKRRTKEEQEIKTV
ncbi:hypothetical protein HYX13_02180 [Candidatus Woesearchaeota archaeon]|nr:hypothetical protein [Candidatus Woesearchaeota archaeon]